MSASRRACSTPEAYPGVQVCAPLKWNPNVCRVAGLHSKESFRPHSYDCEGIPLDVKGLAKNQRISRETPRPVCITKDSQLSVSAFVVERESVSPQQRDAEPRKKVAADHVAFNFFRCIAIAHRDLPDSQRHKRNQIRECGMVLAKIFKHRLRKRRRRVPRAPCSIRLAARHMQIHKFLRVRTGRLLSNTAFMTLNTAVLAPIPSASVRTTIIVNHGELYSCRIA